MKWQGSHGPQDAVVPATAQFSQAAVAFRAAVEGAGRSHLAEGEPFGISPDFCHGLPGAKAEIERAFAVASRQFPADRFDLQQHFRWTADGIEHLIQPRAKH